MRVSDPRPHLGQHLHRDPILTRHDLAAQVGHDRRARPAVETARGSVDVRYARIWRIS
jgi:hypothetical protein